MNDAAAMRLSLNKRIFPSDLSGIENPGGTLGAALWRLQLTDW